jgi:Fic family protein
MEDNHLITALKSDIICYEGGYQVLFYTPRLNDHEERVLEDVEEIRSKLKYALHAPRRWLGALRRSTFARAIRGSNSIEGYNVSAEDAIAAVEGEEPLDAERETWAAIKGYRDAMTYVLQLANDPHFVYGDGFLRSLHFMMINYDLKRNPGRWRPGPIYVRDDNKGEIVYEGPDWELVPDLMSELSDQLNVETRFPSMVRAAMAHLNLVMVHPFSDGNGRMGRCLQTLVLAREGILESQFSSIEEYLGRNTQPYYDVLAEVGKGRWSPSNDARPWLDFSISAHHTQASTLLRRTKEIERVWNELEQLIKIKGLPDRVIYALSDATFGYRIRNSTYRGIADISDSVASRDFKLLVDHGLLRPDGEKRGRAYVSTPVLSKIMDRAREPRQPIPLAVANLYLPGMEP